MPMLTLFLQVTGADWLWPMLPLKDSSSGGGTVCLLWPTYTINANPILLSKRHSSSFTQGLKGIIVIVIVRKFLFSKCFLSNDPLQAIQQL